MLITNPTLSDIDITLQDKKQKVFSESEFDLYSRNLLGVSKKAYSLLLKEAESELQKEDLSI
jgi:hypothetical protein